MAWIFNGANDFTHKPTTVQCLMLIGDYWRNKCNPAYNTMSINTERLASLFLHSPLLWRVTKFNCSYVWHPKVCVPDAARGTNTSSCPPLFGGRMRSATVSKNCVTYDTSNVSKVTVQFWTNRNSPGSWLWQNIPMLLKNANYGHELHYVIEFKLRLVSYIS